MPHPYSPSTQHLNLGEVFFDPVEAADLPETILRYRNQTAAKTVGLEELSDEEWLSHFGRFKPLPDNLQQPLALRYHGHQFRNYNPELGDGRGFLFAQMIDDKDRLLDLGTKGSGQTPWSRAGDGRLTLKGGVREVLATELLTALGVNTSKSFSLIETGERLYRNDEPSPARSSVLVRLNHSHIRIGTFQRLLYLKDHENIEKLVNYSIENYWPEAKQSDNPVLAFYKLVVNAVAKMGAQWFVAGFVHGVLNTDNITITGESFDYGPWRFLPNLDADFTAAYFDHSGLYAFGRQPDALQWNLARLAECLIPLCDIDELKSAIEGYSPIFEAELQKLTLKRLGLKDVGSEPHPLIPLYYKTLQASDALFEQAFFDLAGGAKEERLTQSP
ncbi:MAG: protein adenylyltransferase SelO family protein, partial [Lentilitoribacter sp.]